jgi:pyruvate/2-oxoglutarate dehydrogenase complex dihydrolipoamide acyltransferase (E2) component
MPKDILMPSEMANGTLARWLKKVGERVQTGDMIAEIDSDKASMQIESPCDGVLAAIHVTEGTTGIAAEAVLGTITA